MGSIDQFFTKHFYHIFNKSMDSLSPFTDIYYSKRLLSLARYYRSLNNKLSYSWYENLPNNLKNQFSEKIGNPDYYQVEILAYCIMPNHYHFLLKQKKDLGISKFMNNIINAFTRYYNLINLRKGPVFIPRYKSRLINSEEELIHVSRYIHLNPYSAGITKSINEVFYYKLSSLNEYIHNQILVNTSYILNTAYFLNNKNKYKQFVINHADYQKKLKNLRYLEKWC